jgi:pullulanase/glycogen debranching enzyme
MMNMFWEPLAFESPAGVWRIAVDTASPSPHDIRDANISEPLTRSSSQVLGRSIVVLVSPPREQ